MRAVGRQCVRSGIAVALLLLVVSASGGQESGKEKPEPDQEAIRKLIREELKSAKEEKPADKEEKPTEARNWFEIGLHSQSQDKAFAFHVGGRLEWDNAWFTQDDNLLLGTGSPALLQDGTSFRRARLRADGTVYEFIDFVAQVNFANIQEVPNVDSNAVPVGSVGLTDFYLNFRDLPGNLQLRLGHFKAPLSLERYTSANYLPYMERSSVFDAFYGNNQRQTGVMLFGSWLEDRVTAAGAFTRVSRRTLNNFGFDAEDGLYAGGVRLTGLPVYQDEGRMLLHLGVNFFHQALADNQFSIANRMPLRGGAGPSQVPNFLATGTYFSPNGADLFSLEAAGILGPFSFSGEYAVAHGTDIVSNFDGVRFTGPRGDVTYQAYYVEAGYFVTPGDRRRFHASTATWDRIKPEVYAFSQTDGRWGTGAVQLVARLSYLDLVSGTPPLTPGSLAAGAQAGRQRDVTLGVNWYLNPQTFFMFEYVWTHVDSVVAGASGNAQGIGTRMHFDF